MTILQNLLAKVAGRTVHTRTFDKHNYWYIFIKFTKTISNVAEKIQNKQLNEILGIVSNYTNHNILS